MIITIGKFSRDYKAYYTDAPRRYDYGYCIPLAGPDRPNPKREDRANDYWITDSRLVLIPTDKPEQLARYASGLYQYTQCDMLNENDLTQLVFDKLSPND